MKNLTPSDTMTIWNENINAASRDTSQTQSGEQNCGCVGATCQCRIFFSEIWLPMTIIVPPKILPRS